MDYISFIYQNFSSISIRGKFNINSEYIDGIKICFNPNFWPHSFNFRKIKKNRKASINGFTTLDYKWNNSLQWIINQLNDEKLSIKDKKDLFITWFKNNEEFWCKTKALYKIKDYYKQKFDAWEKLILFLNKYREDKANIINQKQSFSIYKINKSYKPHYDADYVLKISDINYYVKDKNNYVLLYCVKCNYDDKNKKLTINPSKKDNHLSYLFLTLKSIQLRNNFNFDKYEEIKYTNIFLNKRVK